jgi:hypothetical protein
LLLLKKQPKLSKYPTMEGLLAAAGVFKSQQEDSNDNMFKERR